MVEIARYATRRDVEFARAALAAAGIPSVLIPLEPGSDNLVDLGGARLLVTEADADDAAMTLSQLAPAEDDRP